LNKTAALPRETLSHNRPHSHDYLALNFTYPQYKLVPFVQPAVLGIARNPFFYQKVQPTYMNSTIKLLNWLVFGGLNFEKPFDMAAAM
jgi:hypothetical protein